METIDVLLKVGYSKDIALKLANRFGKMPVQTPVEQTGEWEEMVGEPPPISRRPYVMNKSTTEIHSRKSTVNMCNKDLIAGHNREYLTKAAALKLIASDAADGCGHCMSEHSSR